jgi:class 3 adenylate cyclase
MLVDYLEINRHLDVRSVLPALRVPTLVLHRSGDPVFEPFHSRYLADHIPRARRLELPGGNHILWADDHAVADAIEEFLTGAKGDADLDRVLTTVVFTDIVGSTERAQALGDLQWRRLLDGHDDLARRQLDGYRGHLVKTTGDGVLATFDGPARAVRCACAIRDAVADLGLEVRAGVHTGEVELRGDDVGGITVHIGQRIAALADPGQVLVSGTVHDLVFGSGLEFEHRGARTLRGVPGTWPVFAVSGRGSPGE